MSDKKLTPEEISKDFNTRLGVHYECSEDYLMAVKVCTEALDSLLQSERSEKEKLLKNMGVWEVVKDLKTEIESLKKERNAFQTQAGARKREFFELKIQIAVLVEALEFIINCQIYSGSEALAFQDRARKALAKFESLKDSLI